MPIRAASISVGTASAVALASNSLPRSSSWIYVQNGGGGGNIWLGDSTITVGHGVSVASNAGLQVNTGSGPLYAIGDQGTATVRILEVY